MEIRRSRAEMVALVAQLLLVLATALTLSQIAVAGASRDAWLFAAPLLCVLPSAAAFRLPRLGMRGVLLGAVLTAGLLLWAARSSFHPVLDVLGWTWPLFAAAALLMLAVRIRRDREREASRLHRHTHANAAELENSESCGCVACERIFAPDQVVSWIPGPEGDTAVCPFCGVDAVVGSASGIPITASVLARAHARWFLTATDSPT